MRVFELKPNNLDQVFADTEKIIYMRRVATSAELIFEGNNPKNPPLSGCGQCNIF